MPRIKKVTTDEILDAIERVVMKLGVSRLSIDAVAREAGISKTRVVYDYKSKTALLEALVDRQFKRDIDRRRIELEASSGTPHPELFARIRSAEHIPDESEKAVAMAITASMSSEMSIRKKMRDWVLYDLEAMTSGAKPRVARLAYFALLGFGCPEWFGLMEWSDRERLSFAEEIRTMYASYPENQTHAIQNSDKGSVQS
ncbi:MAG: TetR/AcrR family transcriptional regulator [Chlorobiaceae bacterium]|nr:TetR/AcrR family transcriptional regulator [Chlorobiaceae bacterium]NTV60345.1 TetR/AcrR family transcriptional regulator [Chlorobiaceae bacterium]